MKMRLSENFSLSEFKKSITAEAKGIDNTIPEHVKPNIQALADNLLQPLRDLYGKPLTVNSGYRCPILNKAVDGSKTSQHMKGQAADLICESVSELYKLLTESEIDFDQAILYRKKNIVHVSFNPDGNRKEAWVK